MTSTPPLFALTWQPRWPPLEPTFVFARGTVALRLARGLLDTVERLSTVRGVVGVDFLALTAEALPWVDGAHYFGRDAGSPWLLLPTNVAPSLPASWLEVHFRQQHQSIDWPCLVLPTTPVELVPCARVAPIDPTRLETWCEVVSKSLLVASETSR